MTTVVDSGVLIDLLRGDERARLALARAADGDDLWGVVVTRTEVIAGMRSSERAATMRLLDQLAWLDIDVALADAAGSLARTWRRSMPGVGVTDYLIAAGVERLGARLMTLNVRHFPMFDGLEPAYV